MTENNMPFGYNADGTINDRESEVVRYTFDKYIEYYDNPPQQLIDEVLAAAESEGITLTEEEVLDSARAKVIPFLASELTTKFPDVPYRGPVSMVIDNPVHTMPRSASYEMYVGKIQDKSIPVKETICEAVDRELWAKIQEMRRRS